MTNKDDQNEKNANEEQAHKEDPFMTFDFSIEPPTLTPKGFKTPKVSQNNKESTNNVGKNTINDGIKKETTNNVGRNPTINDGINKKTNNVGKDTYNGGIDIFDELYSSPVRIDKENEEILAGVPEDFWDKDRLSKDAEYDSESDLYKSKKTTARYYEVGNRLLNKYQRFSEIPEDEEVDPVDFVNWLISNKADLKSSTWRQYRAASKYFISLLPHSDVETATNMLINDIIEDSDEHENKKGRNAKISRRTSALKAKFIKKDDLSKIISYLKYISRSALKDLAVDWLLAGIYTGLRPSEWGSTYIKRELNKKTGEKEIFLCVLNAKASNGRGTGILRTLNITNLNDDQLETIFNMSNLGGKLFMEGELESTQKQVSQVIYKVCEKIFNGSNQKNYSLYSARHQFIANAKKTMKLEEIAALVGHNTVKTSREHYGKRRSSWDEEDLLPMPVPIASELKNVKKQIEFRADRINKLKMAGVWSGDDEIMI